MDDMLRSAVRRSTFDFEAAAQQIQTYVLRVRAWWHGVVFSLILLPTRVSLPHANHRR